MRQYTVQPGDSPASIAAGHAGCPKCARDLIEANPHKPTVVYPNGYVTFESLAEGETLNLPDKWFSAAFDALPPSYFAALPSADGGVGSLAGVAELEAAAAQIGALASMNDAEFAANIGRVSNALASAVSDVPASQDAGIVRAAAALAQATQDELVAALATGDSAAGFEARTAMLRALSDGLAAARRAVAVPSIPVSTAPVPGAVVQLASFNPCAQTSVAAVCAAQAALGLTVDGKYGDTTAARVRALVPTAPAGCAPRPAWWAPTGVSSCPGAASIVRPPSDAQLPVATSTKETGLSTGAIVGLAALGAGTIGLAIYMSTRPPKRSGVLPRPTRPRTEYATRRDLRSER